MAKKKINKSEKVRRYMAKHPTASVNDIAQATGVEKTTVYNVRAIDRKKGAAGKKKATRGRPKSNASSNGSSQIVNAAEFVKSCGGIDQARSVLDTLEAVADALR